MSESGGGKWCAPSASTTSDDSTQKKSTTNGPTGCCLLNFAPICARDRRSFQSARSAGVEALARYPLPRSLANASSLPAGVEASRTIMLGKGTLGQDGITARVTTVVDPQLAAASAEWASAFPKVGDPIAALDGMRADFAAADLGIVLVHGPRELAETIAKQFAGTVDVVVMAGVHTNPERSRVGSPAVQLGEHGLVDRIDVRGEKLSGHGTSSDAKE